MQKQSPDLTDFEDLPNIRYPSLVQSRHSMNRSGLFLRKSQISFTWSAGSQDTNRETPGCITFIGRQALFPDSLEPAAEWPCSGNNDFQSQLFARSVLGPLSNPTWEVQDFPGSSRIQNNDLCFHFDAMPSSIDVRRL